MTADRNDFEFEDDLSLDNFDLSDIATQRRIEATGANKNKEKRQVIYETVKNASLGAAEGAGKSFLDESNLRKLALSALPKEYKDGFENAEFASDKLTDIYRDASKTIRPAAKLLAINVEKMVPTELSLVKNWLRKFGEAENSYTPVNKQQAENIAIQSSTSEIFGTPIEKQRPSFTKKEQYEQARDQAEGRVKEQIELTRFNSTRKLLSDIRNSTSSFSNYTTTINKAYQQKSLELQFRSYYVLADLLNESKSYYAIRKTQGESIVKNTALPEFVKLQSSERFIDQARTKLFDSINTKLFDKSGYLNGFFDNLKKKIMAPIESLRSALDMSSTAASMMSSMDTSAFDDPSVPRRSKLRDIASTASQTLFGDTVLVDKTADFLNDKVKPTLSKFSPIKAGSRLLARYNNDPQSMIQDGAERLAAGGQADQSSTSLLRRQLGKAKSGLSSLLDFRPTNTTNTQLVSNNDTKKAASPAIFDNRAHRSITEVIPGFLSLILKQATRTANCITKNCNGQAEPETQHFDYESSKFITASQAKTSIVDKVKNKNTSGGNADALQSINNRSENKLNAQDMTRLTEYVNKRVSITGSIRSLETLTDETSKKVLDPILFEKIKKMVEGLNAEEKDKSLLDIKKLTSFGQKVKHIRTLFRLLKVNKVTDKEALYFNHAALLTLMEGYVVTVGTFKSTRFLSRITLESLKQKVEKASFNINPTNTKDVSTLLARISGSLKDTSLDLMGKIKALSDIGYNNFLQELGILSPEMLNSKSAIAWLMLGVSPLGPDGGVQDTSLAPPTPPPSAPNSNGLGLPLLPPPTPPRPNRTRSRRPPINLLSSQAAAETNGAGLPTPPISSSETTPNIASFGRSKKRRTFIFDPKPTEQVNPAANVRIDLSQAHPFLGAQSNRNTTSSTLDDQNDAKQNSLATVITSAVSPLIDKVIAAINNLSGSSTTNEVGGKAKATPSAIGLEANKTRGSFVKNRPLMKAALGNKARKEPDTSGVISSSITTIAADSLIDGAKTYNSFGTVDLSSLGLNREAANDENKASKDKAGNKKENPEGIKSKGLLGNIAESLVEKGRSDLQKGKNYLKERFEEHKNRRAKKNEEQRIEEAEAVERTKKNKKGGGLGILGDLLKKGLPMLLGAVGALTTAFGVLGKGVTLAVRGLAAFGKFLPKIGQGLLAAGKFAVRALPVVGKAALLVGRVAVGALFSPVGMAIAAGVGAYYLIKYLTRNNAGEVTRVRLRQYGFSENEKDYYNKIFELEMLLKNYISYSGPKNNRTITLAAFSHDDKLKVHDIFGVDTEDENSSDSVAKLAEWYKKRFLPVYTAHAVALANAKDDKYFDDVDKLKPDDVVKYLRGLKIPTSVYKINVSPIPALSSLVVTKQEADLHLETVLNTNLKDSEDKRKKEMINEALKKKEKDLSFNEKMMLAIAPEHIKKTYVAGKSFFDGIFAKKKDEEQKKNDEALKKKAEAVAKIKEDAPLIKPIQNTQAAVAGAASYTTGVIPSGGGEAPLQRYTPPWIINPNPQYLSPSATPGGGDYEKPALGEGSVEKGETFGTVKDPSVGNKLPTAMGPLMGGQAGMQYIKKAKSAVNLEKLNPILSGRLLGMAEEYGKVTGKKIQVNSAFREPAGGSSMHNHGLAVDINSGTANELEKLGLMRKYGFTRPVGGEAWHIEQAGTSADPTRAKKDPNFANQAILASAYSGGGGYGTIVSAKFKGRDLNNAKNVLGGANSAEVNPSELYVGKDGKPVSANASMVASGALPSASAAAITPSSTESAKGGGNSGATAFGSTASSGLAGGGGGGGSTAFGSTSSSELVGTSKATGTLGTIDEAADIVGVDKNALRRFASVESSLKTGASNGSSTAGGLFQFTDDTWNSMLEKHGAKYGYGAQTPKSDPKANSVLAAHYYKDNVSQITKDPRFAGMNDPDTAYLAHHFGAAGAKKILGAPDGDSIQNYVGSDVFIANKAELVNKDTKQPYTVGEYKARTKKKLRDKGEALAGVPASWEAGSASPQYLAQKPITKADNPSLPQSGTSSIADNPSRSSAYMPKSNEGYIPKESGGFSNANYIPPTQGGFSGVMPKMPMGNIPPTPPVSPEVNRANSVNIAGLDATNKILTDSLTVHKQVLDAVNNLAGEVKNLRPTTDASSDKGQQQRPQDTKGSGYSTAIDSTPITPIDLRRKIM